VSVPNTIMVAALNSMVAGPPSSSAAWTVRELDQDFGTGGTLSHVRYVQDISASQWLMFNTPTELPVLSPKLGWMVSAPLIDPFQL